jgi:hypothetical protein
MQCFAGFICEADWIGKCCGDTPGPPPGGAAWDENTPWDNNVYWS